MRVPKRESKHMVTELSSYPRSVMDVLMVCLFVCLLASSVGRFDFSRFHFCSVSHNTLTGAGENYMFVGNEAACRDSLCRSGHDNSCIPLTPMLFDAHHSALWSNSPVLRWVIFRALVSRWDNSFVSTVRGKGEAWGVGLISRNSQP